MIVVITKKCPCSYTFKEQKKIKIWPIASKSFIAIAPGRGPKVFKSPDKKEELVSSKCLKGDEDFKELNLSDKSFLVCPKCGTLLYSEIAMNIERTKESEDE